MTRVMLSIQDIAPAARGVREKGQPDTAAIRTAINELGGNLRALGAAHIAVANYLETSRSGGAGGSAGTSKTTGPPTQAKELPSEIGSNEL